MTMAVAMAVAVHLTVSPVTATLATVGHIHLSSAMHDS
jgi:hypothetical protein